VVSGRRYVAQTGSPPRHPCHGRAAPPRPGGICRGYAATRLPAICRWR